MHACTLNAAYANVHVVQTFSVVRERRGYITLKYSITCIIMEGTVKKKWLIIMTRVRAIIVASATRARIFFSRYILADWQVIGGWSLLHAHMLQQQERVCDSKYMRKRLCVSARVHAWPSAREGASRIVINFVLATWLYNAIAVFPAKIVRYSLYPD